MSITQEMERKVTRVGNSLCVTFPSGMLKKIDVNLGDEVTLDLKGDRIIIRKSRKIQLPDNISPDFFDVLKETMSRYDKTLKGLRDK